MDFKRGDTTVHTLTIPRQMYTSGMRVFFMAKETADDDLTDASALISREFGDGDIINTSDDAVQYSLKFEPQDTNRIQFGGESKKSLKGEFEFRYPDGGVKSFPGGKDPIKVTVYPDVRRGNG